MSVPQRRRPHLSLSFRLAQERRAGIVSPRLLRFSCTNDLMPGISKMPAPISQPDDPALLRIDGPIATITLNRPRRVQLDQPGHCAKARAARLLYRGRRRHPGSGDRERRPRLLGRRRSADDWSCGRSGHGDACRRRAAQALSRLHRDDPAHAEAVAVQRPRLGRRRRHGPRLRHRSLHRRGGRQIHAGLCQDRGVAGRRLYSGHRRHGRLPPRAPDLPVGGQFYRAAGP
ncbi:hypothetical protein ACVIWV_005003 [Bradyrhizobium diazoefficiens]